MTRNLSSHACYLLMGVLCLNAGSAASANPILRENSRPGSWGWRVQPSSGHAVEGYASSPDVVAGASLPLHVSTRPAARYRIEVYRLGWYGGAGARRVACVPGCATSRRGTPRTIPRPDPQTGEIRANWPVTDTIRTTGRWVSGEYLAQLVIVRAGQVHTGRWIPFVLRPRHELRNALLVEVPVNTWEAYNNWGGKSLYAYNSSGGAPAVKVSFARPWGYGDTEFTFPVTFEYPLLRFLERAGLALEYVSDVDVDTHPAMLLAHPLSVVLGHGEYWSKKIRDAWDAARDAGRNLAFLGANIGYWQIRYADSHRTIVEYRSSAADPESVADEKTTEFRALRPPRSECELLGVEFQSGGIHPPWVNSYTVVARNNPWLRAAGLHAGDVLRAAVQGEWDAVLPDCVTPAPTVLLQYAGRYPADATLTRAAGGGHVLALGTKGFGVLVDGWGKARCSVDVRAERFLRDALAGLSGVRRSTLPRLGRACVSRPRRSAG